MTKLVLVLATLASTACSSSPSGDPATIGNLTYVVPSGWSSKDLSNPQRAMFEWTPPPADNEHKESVVVIRTERAALAKSATGHVTRLLEDAQKNLPGGTFGPPASISTRFGFHGAKVEGKFTPAGQTVTYRRIHAVLVDDKHLVHVVYTAREADGDHFETVLESIRWNQGA